MQGCESSQIACRFTSFKCSWQTKRHQDAEIGNSASFPVYFLDVVNESENIQGAHNKKAPAKPQLCDSASRRQPRAPTSQHALTLTGHRPSQHWTPLPCG